MRASSCDGTNRSPWKWGGGAISRRSWRLHALLGGVILAGLAEGAEAAGARLRLSILQSSYADALIELGVQANVSILGTSACGSGGRVSLAGSYTLAEALERLLSGAPCRFRIVDPGAVSISAASIPKLPSERDPPRAPTQLSEVVVTATKRPASSSPRGFRSSMKCAISA